MDILEISLYHSTSNNDCAFCANTRWGCIIEGEIFVGACTDCKRYISAPDNMCFVYTHCTTLFFQYIKSESQPIIKSNKEINVKKLIKLIKRIQKAKSKKLLFAALSNLVLINLLLKPKNPSSFILRKAN